MNKQNPEPIFPPDSGENEPTEANPVPQSPTDPKHRTDASGMNDRTLPDTGIAVPAAVRGGGSGSPLAVPLNITPDADDQEGEKS